MAETGVKRRAAIALAAALAALLAAWRTCSKDPSPAVVDAPASSPSTPQVGEDAPRGAGLRAPIAAAQTGNGEVVVAGIDLGAGAVVVQRIDAADRIVASKVALDGVTASADSEIKVAAQSKEGVAVTFRGLRGGKLVRHFVDLGPDLARRGEPAEVPAASCATREGLWFSDGARAVSRLWTGGSSTIELPKDKDASLLCGASRAFALLEDEDRTSILALGAETGPAMTVARDGELGDDEQRELATYTVGDDVGFVRLGGEGAIAVRELTGGRLGPFRRLRASIPKDDDVVAVDASAKVLAIVYTEDASRTCPAGADAVATKVKVLRIDRVTFEESIAELAPARCGHEIGPFYTGVLGDSVSVGWTERAGGAGEARAPIAGLAHATVAPRGAPSPARIDQPADALVDAGCDGTSCFAVALVRGAVPDAASLVKILRYR